MTAHCRESHSWLFITMSGFTTPGTIVSYNFKKPEGQRATPFRQTKVKGLNPGDFETDQVCHHTIFLVLILVIWIRFGIPVKMARRSLCLSFATNPRPLMVPLLLFSMVMRYSLAFLALYSLHLQDMAVLVPPSPHSSIRCSSHSYKYIRVYLLFLAFGVGTSSVGSGISEVP